MALKEEQIIKLKEQNNYYLEELRVKDLNIRDLREKIQCIPNEAATKEIIMEYETKLEKLKTDAIEAIKKVENERSKLFKKIYDSGLEECKECGKLVPEEKRIYGVIGPSLLGYNAKYFCDNKECYNKYMAKRRLNERSSNNN